MTALTAEQLAVFNEQSRARDDAFLPSAHSLVEIERQLLDHIAAQDERIAAIEAELTEAERVATERNIAAHEAPQLAGQRATELSLLRKLVGNMSPDALNAFDIEQCVPDSGWFEQSKGGSRKHVHEFYCPGAARRLNELEQELADYRTDCEHIAAKLQDGTLHCGHCNADHKQPLGCDMCCCPPGREIKRLRAELAALRKQHAAVDVDGLAKLGFEANQDSLSTRIKSLVRYDWQKMPADQKADWIATAQAILSHLHPPQQEPAAQPSREELEAKLAEAQRHDELCKLFHQSLNDICNRHGAVAGANKLEWVDQQLGRIAEAMCLLATRVESSRLDELTAERDDLKSKLSEAERQVAAIACSHKQLEGLHAQLTAERDQLQRQDANKTRLLDIADAALTKLANARGGATGQYGENAVDAESLVEWVLAERDQLRQRAEEAQRERDKKALDLRTIRSICFGGLMPDGWSLDGLVGEVNNAILQHNREKIAAEHEANDEATARHVVEKERDKAQSDNSRLAAELAEAKRLLATRVEASRVDELAGELREAKNYLSRLLKSHAPQCKPFESICFICSQIDNCMAGMRDELAAARRREEGLRRACEPLVVYFSFHPNNGNDDQIRMNPMGSDNGTPSVTYGQIRAFLAAISPEPAPPSEQPAGERAKETGDQKTAEFAAAEAVINKHGFMVISDSQYELLEQHIASAQSVLDGAKCDYEKSQPAGEREFVCPGCKRWDTIIDAGPEGVPMCEDCEWSGTWADVAAAKAATATANPRAGKGE